MIRILVYGSSSVVLTGLISILDDQPHLEVVGSFTDQASLRSLDNINPDLLLWEQASDQDLWWLENWMSTIDWDLTGILLTDSIATEEINEYLNLGWKGFLPRLANTEQIITAIDTVMTGLIVIHPDLALFEESQPAIAPLLPSEFALTSREIEVLQLLGSGLNNKAIASTLQISQHTVKFHISSILSKLDVSSRTEAVTLGFRQGLIRL